MGELTGRLTPQTTIVIEKVKDGVKWSIPVMVPDIEHMDEATKAALQLKLAASIDDKILASIEEQARRGVPTSMSYRPGVKEDQFVIPMPYPTPDVHQFYDGIRGRSYEMVVGDETERLPELPEGVEYPQGKAGVPKVRMPEVRPWKIDGKLCLTTTAHVQALLGRQTSVRTDSGV